MNATVDLEIRIDSFADLLKHKVRVPTRIFSEATLRDWVHRVTRGAVSLEPGISFDATPYLYNRHDNPFIEEKRSDALTWAGHRPCGDPTLLNGRQLHGLFPPDLDSQELEAMKANLALVEVDLTRITLPESAYFAPLIFYMYMEGTTTFKFFAAQYLRRRTKPAAPSVSTPSVKDDEFATVLKSLTDRLAGDGIAQTLVMQIGDILHAKRQEIQQLHAENAQLRAAVAADHTPALMATIDRMLAEQAKINQAFAKSLDTYRRL